MRTYKLGDLKATEFYEPDCDCGAPWGTRDVPLAESKYVQCLAQNDPGVLQRYVEIRGRRPGCQEVRTRDRWDEFQKLTAYLRADGDPTWEHPFRVWDCRPDVLKDGFHRAAALYVIYGADHPIEVEVDGGDGPDDAHCCADHR